MTHAGSVTRGVVLALAFASLGAVPGCGGKPAESPPPPPAEEAPRSRASAPRVSQELGTIDQAKVEQTFAGLIQGPLETCHKQGRDRIEVLTGDVKVFLRIDASGKMRYGFFEESSVGDRDTEKCMFDVFANATWPKPEGGEAEVRSGFGWGPGGEREPTAWSPDKVTGALADAKGVKQALDKCKGSIKGDFRVTAYVEATEGDGATAPAAAPAATPAAGKHGKKPKSGKPAPSAPAHAKKSSGETGHFRGIGVAPPSKEGAEKIDCIVDALRPLELPSPGSYPAKVSFAL